LQITWRLYPGGFMIKPHSGFFPAVFFKFGCSAGDGNSNNGASMFPDCVEKALRQGWKVEVWSWKRSTSQVYRTFASEYASQFELVPLDLSKQTFLTSDDYECAVCLDNTSSVCLRPCKHMCLCDTCANDLKNLDHTKHKCPLCNTAVEEFERVFR
jgi:hypothetical protein